MVSINDVWQVYKKTKRRSAAQKAMKHENRQKKNDDRGYRINQKSAIIGSNRDGSCIIMEVAREL